MKYGLIIRGQYPEGDDMRQRHKEDLEAARRAEELGYDVVAKGSHYSSYPFQYIQQIPYLAQVAMLAPKLRLLPGVVLLPLHSPLHVAEELASLDVMSDGKLIFGAGIGYREIEFNAFGTTLKSAGPRFEECLTAVKRLWTEDFVSMQASYFKLDGANCTVKPIQKPMPPVWIGAHGGCVVHQSAQQIGHHRTADGGVQARPRCRRQALPRRIADGARGLCGPVARRSDPPRQPVS